MALVSAIEVIERTAEMGLDTQRCLPQRLFYYFQAERENEEENLAVIIEPTHNFKRPSRHDGSHSPGHLSIPEDNAGILDK